jgi:hypothetical protein
MTQINCPFCHNKLLQGLSNLVYCENTNHKFIISIENKIITYYRIFHPEITNVEFSGWKRDNLSKIILYNFSKKINYLDTFNKPYKENPYPETRTEFQFPFTNLKKNISSPQIKSKINSLISLSQFL